jgi:hypothetical protein
LWVDVFGLDFKLGIDSFHQGYEIENWYCYCVYVFG